MLFRNLMNLKAAAAVAITFTMLPGGSSVSGQQPGCPSCGTQTVNFGSTVSSSQPFISTAPYVAGSVLPSSIPSVTYATGSPVEFSGTVAQPIGTFTSSSSTSTSFVSPTSYQPVYRIPATTIQPPSRISSQPTPVRSTLNAGRRVVNSGVGVVSNGLAQMKAQRAANSGIRGHIGGGLGGARFEGVGWSSVSAQDAIENCCYWGQRPTAQIGVSRGADGLWYACVLYN